MEERGNFRSHPLGRSRSFRRFARDEVWQTRRRRTQDQSVRGTGTVWATELEVRKMRPADSLPATPSIGPGSLNLNFIATCICRAEVVPSACVNVRGDDPRTAGCRIGVPGRPSVAGLPGNGVIERCCSPRTADSSSARSRQSHLLSEQQVAVPESRPVELIPFRVRGRTKRRIREHTGIGDSKPSLDRFRDCCPERKDRRRWSRPMR